MCLTSEVLFKCGFTFELTFRPRRSLCVFVCAFNKGTCIARQVEQVTWSRETTLHTQKSEALVTLDRRVRWEGSALYRDRIIAGERHAQRKTVTKERW